MLKTCAALKKIAFLTFEMFEINVFTVTFGQFNYLICNLQIQIQISFKLLSVNTKNIFINVIIILYYIYIYITLFYIIYLFLRPIRTTKFVRFKIVWYLHFVATSYQYHFLNYELTSFKTVKLCLSYECQ